MLQTWAGLMSSLVHKLCRKVDGGEEGDREHIAVPHVTAEESIL